MCKCAICVRVRKLRMVLKNGSRNQIIKFVTGIMDDLCEAEADLDWHRCVMNGSWPTAEEVLTSSLASVRKKKDEARSESNKD